MKQVAEVRKKLGVPTIFNLLGPLSNPAGAPFQVLGVGRAELRPLLAEALLLLGTRRALVVHGEDGLDEVTLGRPHAGDRGSRRRLAELQLDAGRFRPGAGEPGSLRVDGPAESAGDDSRSAAPARRARPATSWCSTPPRRCGRPARPTARRQAAELAAAAIDAAQRPSCSHGWLSSATLEWSPA